MKQRLHPGWRTRLLAMAAGLGCALSVLAQDTPFAGRWLLDEQPGAAAAAYPVLTIKGDRMSWGGPTRSAPACVQQFVLQNEKPGTMYVNGRGTKFIAGVAGSLPTYLLKLRANGCAGGADAVRIIYPTVYGSRQIEVLEYVNGKVVSARRLHRKQ
ncbi:hypothetical protein [Herbaspirillum sp. SJZ107]|uniref:hypothetical protein n=1 Tax=Herbaspirillum sp. SJZ107 TaxID=2572881 RepID=UPI001154B92D|nr:hypothetical protein [Herbaspirillum sp. SJZ107]